MSAPTTPERTLEHVERFIRDNSPRRIVIQTRYGETELPVDEIWLSDMNRTLFVTVNLPADTSKL